LVALQKRSLPDARSKASALGIPYAFSTTDDLVRCEEVDAVFIVSANSAHCPETISAARAGKHVLVEKPMALNIAEAESMVQECDSNHVKLMVGQVVRFSPVVHEIRKLIQSGGLGRIVSARADYIYDARLTHRTWLYDRVVAGGGPIFDIGIHCLDTLCYVLDDTVASVRSQLSPQPTRTTTERSAILSLLLSKGTVASITCSFEAPVRQNIIEIVGTEGSAMVQDFTQGSRNLTLQIGRRIDGTRLASEQREIDVPNMYVEEVTAFSRCILEGLESPVPGIVGVRHQEVLDLSLTGGGILKYGKDA
jgi:predicted dehydrogenase